MSGNAESRAPLLSVVVPTRNEARNIGACVAAVDPAANADWLEMLVVDNASTDGTADIARGLGVPVFEQGPERSAQRNRGWREARGQFVCFLDADMRMPAETLDEIRRRISAPDAPDALYIREERVGTGWWIRVRNFERSFYDATCIDALRVVRRSRLRETGGYDEALNAFEDWDLDLRLLAAGTSTALTDRALLHDEGAFSWRRHLRKKTAYSTYYDRYRAKWGAGHPVLRRQLGFGYRFFGVFLERGKWRRALRHPLWMASIFLERLLVALCLVRRRILPHA